MWPNLSAALLGTTTPDTISSVEDSAGKAVRLNGRLELDIMRFECQSKMIINDLGKTLKAGEYPKPIIRFLSRERTPSLQGTPQTMKGWVEVELADTRKAFQVYYESSKGLLVPTSWSVKEASPSRTLAWPRSLSWPAPQRSKMNLR